MDSGTENLIVAINCAFDGVSRGGGISLHEAEEIDCHGSLEERARARLLDGETRWQEVPAETIEGLPSAPTFLDADGLRYYLPALMVWSLKYGKQSESATTDTVLSLLGLPDRQEWLERSLSCVQRHVIARFVKWGLSNCWVMHDQSTSDLAAYWRRHLEAPPLSNDG